MNYESKLQIWHELSKEIDAKFVPRSNANMYPYVQARHAQFTVTLDIETENPSRFILNGHGEANVFTRYRAPVVNEEGLRFKIYREGIMSKIGKLVGMQDVVLGYPDFDDVFIIQTNNDKQLKTIFRNKEIRDALLLERGITLELLHGSGVLGNLFSKDSYVLEYKAAGEIFDKQRLRRQFSLITLLLDELLSIGLSTES